jgi:F0F1-type ATP synthase assembly protein I
MNEVPSAPAPPPRYRWPWFLGAAVLLGILLAVISVRKEVDRVRTQRQLQLPNAEE